MHGLCLILSAILLAFVRKLCPNYAPTISAIFRTFLGQLCPDYAQRDNPQILPFAPNMPCLLPQLCLSYISAGYRVALYTIAFKNSLNMTAIYKLRAYLKSCSS